MLITLYVVCALFTLELILVFPTLRRHKNRKLLDGLLIAHRGLHDIAKGVPENSYLAYQKAIDAGYAIEIDVHLTKDNRLVILHDDHLDRLCGVKGECEHKTLEELLSLPLQGTKEKIPELGEFLQFINGRVPLMIELKYTRDGRDEILCHKTADLLDHYPGLYFIQSFFTPILVWFRQNRPHVMRGQLSSNLYKYNPKNLAAYPFSWFWCNLLGRPDFVSYDVMFYRNFSFRLVKLLGAFPVGWTFTSAKQLQECKSAFRAWIFEEFDPRT